MALSFVCDKYLYISVKEPTNDLRNLAVSTTDTQEVDKKIGSSHSEQNTDENETRDLFDPTKMAIGGIASLDWSMLTLF